MITAKEFPNRTFETRDDLLKAIVEELPVLMAAKKSAIKETDGFNLSYNETPEKDFAIKGLAKEEANATEITRKVVMNTTGLLDSHGDVHIKDIWKRTLQHNPKKLHLQEHKRDFDKVIASDAMAYTKTMSWKSLGADFEGSTQALIFESRIKQERNPMMFNQYKNGWVENHSVGMQYVGYEICIDSNDEWAKEYKANWDKYYPEIVNPEAADENKYFWAVTEAKLMEGSAVLMGSNWVTPTLENKSESEQSLQNDESEQSTQKHEDQLKELLKKFN